MSNKTNLTYECTRILKLSKKGSHITRQTHIKLIKTIIEDLHLLRITPRYISELEEKDLIRLVDYWVSQKYKTETMANKISALRKVFTLMGTKNKLPTNKKLGINIGENKTEKPIVTEAFIEKIEHPITKTIVDFEVNFGLTKTESIKLPAYAVTKEQVTIYRDIAYNHRDRVIPVVSSKQRNVIESRKEILKKFSNENNENKESLLGISTFDLLSALYRVDMAILGVEGHSHFRDIYMKSRYLELGRVYPIEAVKKILMSELGLSSNRLLAGLANE